jgi:hypothetical protein
MSLEKDLVQECRSVAETFNAFLAVVGQRDSRKSGSTLGFPDLVLICNGQIRLIEMKRGKDAENPAGHLNLGQHAFIAAALEQGVTVEVVDNLNDFVSILNSCRRPRGVQRREVIQSW